MLDTAKANNNTIPITMANLMQRIIKLEETVQKLLASNQQSGKKTSLLKLISPTLLKNIFTPENTSKYVEDYFYLSPGDLKIRTRKAAIVQARQFAMYMLWDKNKALSLKQIGSYFGRYDHSTVIHSRQAVLDRFDTEPGQLEFYKGLTLKMVEDYIKEQQKD